jgi:hypothetical protein
MSTHIAPGRVSVVCLLLALMSSCAPVKPRDRSPALSMGARTAVLQNGATGALPLTGQPMEAVVRDTLGGAHPVDPFEDLLLRAGLERIDELPPRDRPLDRDGATRLLNVLVNRPLPMRRFPQRMGACFLLREVIEKGAASREELVRRTARFRMVAVLRPDGYLAWVLNGRTQQRAGPGRVELKDGVFTANGFELGRFYTGLHWAFRLADAEMNATPDSRILAEVYDDADLFGRTMDGVESAFVEIAMALGKALSRPVDTIAALRNLPESVALLIASSPAYLERFENMTPGEQIEAVAKLYGTVIATFASGGVAAGSVTRGLGGTETLSLSLSANGALALTRVAVPAGEAVAVLAGGMATGIVLNESVQATGKLANPPDGPRSFVPESYMDPRLLVDMEPARKLARSTTNAAGQVRNAGYFWRQLLKRYPEMFSDWNRYRIEILEVSPRVDAVWAKHNPTHASFMGDILHHHHLEHGRMAVPLPQTVHGKWTTSLHPGAGWR